MYAHADMLRLMMVSKLMHVTSATQQTLASAHGGRCVQPVETQRTPMAAGADG